MKKFTLFTLSLLTLFIFNVTYLVSAEKTSALGATYEVVENIANKTLDYGIEYINDKAISSTKSLTTGASENDAQVVNLLNVPLNTGLKVVNWTYMNATGWSKQTVKDLAKDFEKHNAGWSVIAATNGDFFDIGGKGHLPYQTGGVAYCNNELYKPSGHAAVGFTNNGTKNSFVAGVVETTSYHHLDIFDASGNIVKSYKIDNFNSSPVDSEISLWYTYNLNEKVNEEIKQVPYVQTTSDKNTFIVENPIRGLAMSDNDFYGKGQISKTNQVITLGLGQFAIETTNEEIKNYLTVGSTIRVSRKVTGAFADCDNITGCGVTLIKDGEAVSNADGMNDWRHPRTMVGKKADGSIVLATVDGRQAGSGMTGMTYEELSATLLHYGCVEAYNLDGGGSTTMIIRDGEGGFKTMNSPSDGAERRDSNALLIVAPELKLSIDQLSDTSISLSHSNDAIGVDFSNVNITINNVTKKFATNQITFDKLEKNTSYKINYSYDLTYNGKTLTKQGKEISFTTGKAKPTINNLYYELVDGIYKIHFEIDDPDNILSMVTIKYKGGVHFIDNHNQTSISISAEKVKEENFLFIFEYDFGSTPANYVKESLSITLKEEEQKSGCKKKNKNLTAVIQSVSLLSLALFLFRKK